MLRVAEKIATILLPTIVGIGFLAALVTVVVAYWQRFLQLPRKAKIQVLLLLGLAILILGLLILVYMSAWSD
jgi:hypothetical protein